MRRAQEMAEITETAKRGIAQEIQDIEPQLIAAAQEGQSNITLPRDVTLHEWDVLVRMGYTVETLEQRDEAGYHVSTTISW